ncbi:hypothetical protein QCA50_008167 [Cerrena zonata]|uniref:Uncharacterized protein n=1 Tax=Cerrena zonata TaxID=2478898 RepID=A0AAW0GF76_9APHY
MTDHLEDHESIIHTDTNTNYSTTSNRLSSNGGDPEEHTDHPAFPLGLRVSISQLSTLVLSLGSNGTNTRVDPQRIVSFLAQCHNLENLSLRNVITAPPFGIPSYNRVYLFRLRSLCVSDGARETASILHHLVIPSDAKVDINMITLPDLEALFDMFYFVGRTLRSGFISMRQIVEALSLQPTIGGMVVKAYVDIPGLQDICDPESAASVRLSFPVADQNRSWMNGLFLAITTDLHISSIKLLLMGDLAVEYLADAALASFLNCMPMMERICLVETKLDVPVDMSHWEAVITLGSGKQPELADIYHELVRTVNAEVYFRSLWRLLISCEVSGLGVCDVRVERIRAVGGEEEV